MKSGSSITGFIRDFNLADVPEDIVLRAKRCISDLTAAAAGGILTHLSETVRNFSSRHWPAGTAPSRMMFDGRRVTRPAAALAGGMTIDAFDIHDGHPVAKGHAGAAVLPAVLAYTDSMDDVSGERLLAAVILGYEFGLRAGVAMNQRGGFPSSGAWASIGVAAAGAYLLRLSEMQTRHALGIAEYHSPISPVTRCLDNPTMLKDGIGWGALVGVTAVDLAAEGFTGAPALLCEASDMQDLWSDLGQRWYIRELYFRKIPSCRMAQPAIEAALSLQLQHQVPANHIAQISVSTFDEAKRLMNSSPQTAEEAQYSLPYVLAVALRYGHVRAEHLEYDALRDPLTLKLSESVKFSHNSLFNERWPKERLAKVTFQLFDGRLLESEVSSARGDPEIPFSDIEMDEKYYSLVEPVTGKGRAQRIMNGIATLATAKTDCRDLLNDLLDPVMKGSKNPDLVAASLIASTNNRR